MLSRLLKIPDFDTIDQLSENISQATFKAIFKYHKHPSIKTINQAFPNNYFNFSLIEKKIVLTRL